MFLKHFILTLNHFIIIIIQFKTYEVTKYIGNYKILIFFKIILYEVFILYLYYTRLYYTSMIN